MTTTSQKVIFCGQFMEVYQYEIPLNCGFRKRKQEARKRQKQSMKRRADSFLRSRQKIRRLINTNSATLKKFLTLTFAKNVKDLDFANSEFKAFIRRIKTLKNNFQYIAVVEFQERGAVHYHLICNLQYLKNEDLRNIWKHGFVKINRVDKIDNLGAYLSKYMSKDVGDSRLFGRKCFFYSRNNDKPVVVVDNSTCKEILKCYNLDNAIKKFTFENEWRGKVNYYFLRV